MQKKLKVKPLFKHQKKSIEFMKGKDIVLDASDPGTAKTRVQLEVFAARRRNKGKCALVLAPKSILRNAWGDDAKEFVPDMKVSIAYATNRQKAFDEPADIYVTNFDAVKWIAEQPPAFFKRFDTIIIDESPAFKHHTSGRSRALDKIKKYFKYRSAMTGTPNANTICDIWNQINFLDNGKRLGGSFYAFRNTVCIPTQVGRDRNAIRWDDKEGAEEAVSSLIQDITIRHKFKDCIDIPPTHTFTRTYYPSDKQIKAYQQMADHAIMLLKKGTVSAINQAAVRTKLLQIASGAVYETPTKYHVVDEGRYELVADLIEERAHSIVFYLWQHQRDELIREFNARKIKHCVMDGDATPKMREDMKNNYQNGFYQVMLAHPMSAAHGLTLTKGTATIWASPTDNLEWWVQGNRRQARAGQKQKTEVIALLADQTIEHRLYARLNEKGGRMDNLLDLLE